MQAATSSPALAVPQARDGRSPRTPSPTRAPTQAHGAPATPCRTAPADLFFAEDHELVLAAKALCSSCPLRAACLAGALARREPAGVWGGQLFVGGVAVAYRRGRGRPRKDAPPLTPVL
ncbi:WhiB family transcriptional regulator [Paenibacillus sp. TRM 82003]|uniref:WhiB family transcriptional regulator n=1 Tax=Kineococcus sp. TRM81007 TaxID=2925831 RepID=UPI001F55C7F4|nr:WhiB family transcriptional regulator [Kineococcus sp. TRM81007]MCI2240023.1 WhiB family transcriptional regulator [Kineococcus sp. TRM81007]MCI3925671.1 WhiB family transcriptional regulator [Paenibacillus sp. TRM 82003]